MQLAVPCLLSDFNASTHTDPIQVLKEQTIVHEQSNDREQLSTETPEPEIMPSNTETNPNETEQPQQSTEPEILEVHRNRYLLGTL